MAGTDDLSKLQLTAASDFTSMGLQYRAAKIAQAFDGRLPAVRELRDISEELGPELASAVLQRCLMNSRAHGGFFRELQQAEIAVSSEARARMSAYEVTIVASQMPLIGRTWGDHAEEWRAWARELGFRTEVIETSPRLSVANNARVIREFLAANPHPNRILVTYGQGTAEFRYLLHRIKDESEIRGVRAWISVCGAYAGAAFSQNLRQGVLRRIRSMLSARIQGRNPVVLAETSPQFALWKGPAPLPKGLLPVSVIGLPLRFRLPQGMNAMHEELAKDGPNDGVVRALDACIPHGFIVPVTGMSHRAEGRWLQPLFKRLLVVTEKALEERSGEKVRELSLQTTNSQIPLQR